MIEGKLLEALTAVVGLRSFEKAANHLGITQSAVSQRIQALEAKVGVPLVIRSPQTEATAAGERMVRLAHQVEGLETDAMISLGIRKSGDWVNVPVGVNADSLATWFKGPLGLLMRDYPAVIELTVCDQSETIDCLRSGSVLACVSSWDEPIQGCSCESLGKMVYRCVASRDALKRLGTSKLDKKLAANLPAVIFGRRDDIVADYVKRSIGLDRHQYPSHVVPATADLMGFVSSGYGYSLLPALQIDRQLERGELVDINPKRTYSVNLFWHRWKISTEAIDKLSEYVVSAARARLTKN